MDPSNQNIVQSWLIALGPWVLSGVVALLAWLGKRLIDKQDEQEKVTSALDKGHAVLSERVDTHAHHIDRHQQWLQEHQLEIQTLRAAKQ